MIKHNLEFSFTHENVRVQETVASDVADVFFQLSISGDGIESLLFLDGAWYPVDSEIVEHPPLGSRNHLILSRRSQLTRMWSMIVDTAGVDQQRKCVEELSCFVDLFFKTIEGQNDVLENLFREGHGPNSRRCGEFQESRFRSGHTDPQRQTSESGVRNFQRGSQRVAPGVQHIVQGNRDLVKLVLRNKLGGQGEPVGSRGAHWFAVVFGKSVPSLNQRLDACHPLVVVFGCGEQEASDPVLNADEQFVPA
ncbi:unnamed protein product [Cyprideis torosa]|uniref:Uncharacterized protein n=1 Tax=Cyprideis torosa TaxID=163714 RepID=A0A7R8W774_9CRUS|nr:unnamed protein product [Cyprideis torosa]CAG0884874.1 unnamed protein product [Cyprideis torosa]